MYLIKCPISVYLLTFAFYIKKEILLLTSKVSYKKSKSRLVSALSVFQIPHTAPKRNGVTHFHSKKKKYFGLKKWALAGTFSWFIRPWQESQKINFGLLTYTFCAARCVLSVIQWDVVERRFTGQNYLFIKCTQSLKKGLSCFLIFLFGCLLKTSSRLLRIEQHWKNNNK